MNNKKRVCYPSGASIAGGSNNSTLLLAQGLNKQLYKSILVFPEEGPIISRAKEKNLNFKIVPTNEFMKNARRLIKKGWLGKIIFALTSIPYLIKIARFLKKNKIDLIHTNDLRTTLLWGIIGKLYNIPVIWHVRQENSSQILDKIRLMLVDKLIFVAELNKRKFSSEVLKNVDHEVVYNGVDVTEFQPNKEINKLKKELKISSEKKLVGFVGYLVPRKRPEMFVKAGLEVLKKSQDVHFIVVGDDPLGSGYEKRLNKMIAKAGAKNHFSLLGYRDDVSDIMAELDVFVLTSTFKGEAFPRVVIEAMAAGTSVVATKSAGVPEAVIDGETGFLVDPNDERKLVKDIDFLLKNEAKNKLMAKKARSRALKLFDIKKINQKIDKIYRGILNFNE